MALEFESSDDIAAQFLELMDHDLPLDYWSRFPQKVQAVGTEEVLRATQRYLDPERNVIVLVGSAAGFSRELDKLGAYQVISVRDLDFASPDLTRAAHAAVHGRAVP